MPLIAAGIGAVAQTGLSWLGGKKAKKQAKKAAKLQAAQSAQNSALAKVLYGENKGLFAPSAVQGQRAGNVLMEMLLGGPPGGGGGAIQPSALAGVPAGPVQPSVEDQFKYLMAQVGPKRTKKIMQSGGDTASKLQMALGLAHGDEKKLYDAYMTEHTVTPSIYEQGGLGANGMGGGAVDANGNPVSALSAFDQFRNSSDYQWRLGEGQRGVNTAWAGDFESPAAAMAMENYSGHMANQELGTWMDRLAQQQGIGLNSAGNIANAGQNMYGQVTGAQQAATDAKMNQYGVSSQAAQNLYGTAAQGIGQVASAAFAPTGSTGYGGSSYGGGGSVPGGGIYDNIPPYLLGP